MCIALNEANYMLRLCTVAREGGKEIAVPSMALTSSDLVSHLDGSVTSPEVTPKRPNFRVGTRARRWSVTSACKG